MNKKFAICLNNKIENSIIVKNNLEEIFRSNAIDYKVLDTENLENGFDFVFVIGGDGTILKTARYYSDFQTPVLGVNLGRLGFLSQATPDDLPSTVNKVLNGEFKVEQRMMLGSEKYCALNDFVVKGSATGRTSRFALEINGKFVCEYLADGIIISTPTGSTAYSYSAGGPIVEPEAKNIIITPICAHEIGSRCIVASDKRVISVEQVMNARRNAYLSVDGGRAVRLNMGDVATIQKSHLETRLVRLKDRSFYDVVSSKFNRA